MKKTLLWVINLLLAIVMMNTPCLASDYSLYFDINFVGNLIFSKYDVDVYLDDEKIDTIPHGKDYTHLIESIEDGYHTVKFYSTDSSDVSGEDIIEVKNDTTFQCTLFAYSDRIEIENPKTVAGVEGSSILIPDETGKILSTAEKQLDEAGIRKITSEAEGDSIWDHDNWIVIGQNVAAGDSVDQNTEIVLTCEKTKKYLEKFLIDMPIDDALKKAGELGFSVDFISKVNGEKLDENISKMEKEGCADWKVAEIDPASGKKEATLKMLYYGKIEMPNVIGISLADALSDLKDLNFNDIAYESYNGDSIWDEDNWEVISQNATPGEAVSAMDQVSLVVQSYDSIEKEGRVIVGKGQSESSKTGSQETETQAAAEQQTEKDTADAEPQTEKGTADVELQTEKDTADAEPPTEEEHAEQNLETEQIVFSDLTDLLTAENHPKLYDSGESAHEFYKQAPDGSVAITTWTELLINNHGVSPDFTVLWLCGKPPTLEEDSEEDDSTVGFVTIKFSSLPNAVDIDTAIDIVDSFIPAEFYMRSSPAEKYVKYGADIKDERRICWQVPYDTISSELDRGKLVVEFYSDSDDCVKEAYTSFSDDYIPGEEYTKVGWDDPVDVVSDPEESKTEKTAILSEEETVKMYATTNVNIRSGPSTDTERIGTLQQGESVQAGASENGWTQILLPGGIGYVSSQYLSASEIAETEPYAVTDGNESNERLVWIPTNGGQKYHSRSGCSGMRNPRQVTLSEALAMGYGACKKCN